MKLFKIQDGRAAFWQWDLDRKLIIDDYCKEVHFYNGTSDNSLVCDVYEQDGQLIVDVPNILLQTARAITVYAFVKSDAGGFTRYAMLFPVHPRTKPNDYAYTETEVRTWNALSDRIAELEGDGLANAVADYFKKNPINTGSKLTIGVVELLADNWVGGTSPYSQVVEVPGATPYSQIDLTPSVEQLAIFHDKDLAFVTENEDGVVTVYAIGDKPNNDYTMQVTIKEVSV